MGYYSADTELDLPDPIDVPVGCYARVGDTWFRNRAITRQWEELDGTPKFYRDQERALEDSALWEDDDDELWVEIGGDDNEVDWDDI